MNADVLVVGAGPTGLALALRLLREGIRPVIVEKLATGRNTSRAAVIHAHTLEVLESIGVAKELVAAGLPLARFSLRDRDRVLARLRFDALPSRYAQLLMLPQDVTESILLRAVTSAGGTVHWSHAVEALEQTPQGVRATVVSAAGRQEILARHVVGADGMHSLVRQTAGIGFTGSSYEESFLLADVRMTWEPGREEVMLFFSPAGLVVVAPLPNGGFRIVATLENAPEQAGVAEIQSLLDLRGPARGAGRVAEVLWSSRFRVHHRVADRYRSGPYFVMGDAAHVHSPAGGQGMNAGLIDACVLGSVLADVISGRCAESHLDRYEALRRPAAQQVLKLANRLTRMATMKNPVQRFLRNTVLGAIGMLPAARRRLEWNLSGLSRRACSAV
jgi:2-polyprenyl-6-methoxyphenol hydroxylase-like FAD-dependent oxidoreductase